MDIDWLGRHVCAERKGAVMSDFQVIERAQRDQLGEGPFWSARENALYWVDIKAPRVNRLALDERAVDSWPMPEAIGWLIERRNGAGFVAGFKSGFAMLTLDPLTISPIADPEPLSPDTRMNDAKADARGRIWAGTMDEQDQARPIGSLYRLDPDLSWRSADGGYHIANGPAFSPDQRTLYHADSARRVVYRYDLTDEGGLENKRAFVTFADDWGYPDGMTVDEEGCVWIAAWGGGRINRFAPDGVLDRSIALPASQVTSCAFGGPRLDRLFVTTAAMGREDEPSAGALFEVDARCRGLPPGQFGG
jgi:D-xylonolactonase